ncbi:hypothetical protein D3C76_1503690 [compost metagenome]
MNKIKLSQAAQWNVCNLGQLLCCLVILVNDRWDKIDQRMGDDWGNQVVVASVQIYKVYM